MFWCVSVVERKVGWMKSKDELAKYDELAIDHITANNLPSRSV